MADNQTIIPAQVQSYIDQGALVVVNHSGGKDSQAMTAKLRNAVPINQLVVVHVVLPDVDWQGTENHARETCRGMEFHSTQAGKTFFEMVEHRGKFPSPQYRQCTSDLKRGPIDKLIRKLCRQRKIDLVVNCMGMRAEESTARAKQKSLKRNNRLSKAGREVLDWLPIHDMLIDDVFRTIEQAGQVPHWAYSAGMTRLSCCFCIMASRADLQTAARLNPDLYMKYIKTEKRLGFTLQNGHTLEEWTGIIGAA